MSTGDVTVRIAASFSYGKRSFGKGESVSPDDPDVRVIMNKRPDLLRVTWRRSPYYRRS